MNPCAMSRSARPETYFAFDTQTEEILPSELLSSDDRYKAQVTIDDLGINEWHHLKNRLEWIQLVSAIITDDTDSLTASVEIDRAHFASRTTPFSSITRAWLSERRLPVDDRQSQT